MKRPHRCSRNMFASIDSDRRVLYWTCRRCGMVREGEGEYLSYDHGVTMVPPALPAPQLPAGLRPDPPDSHPLDPPQLLYLVCACGTTNSVVDNPGIDQAGRLRWDCRECQMPNTTPLFEIQKQRVRAALTEIQLRDLLLDLRDELRET